MKLDVQDINGILIFGVGVNAIEIPRPLPDIGCVTDLLPCFAAVVRSKEPAVLGFDHCPQTIGIYRRNGNVYLSQNAGRQTLISGNFGPGVAAVRSI